MDNVLLTIIIFILNMLTIAIVLPSSEIVSNLKVKNSISASIFNYYRNIVQVISTVQIANVSFHLIVAHGFLILGFSLYQTNMSLIMLLLASMGIVCVIKDILIEEDSLKKDKIVSQIIVSLLMLFSMKLASEDSFLIYVIPLLNYLMLKLHNTNKNKHQFELRPSLLFIDKGIFYFALYAQKILILKNIFEYESSSIIMILSSGALVAEVYFLELITITSIVSRKPMSKRLDRVNATSIFILLLLALKYWRRIS